MPLTVNQVDEQIFGNKFGKNKKLTSKKTWQLNIFPL